MKLLKADNFYNYYFEELKKRREGYKYINLAIIQVGENKASDVYVNNKIKLCNKLNIDAYKISLPTDLSLEELYREVIKAQRNFTGVIVQLPLPAHLKGAELLFPHLIDYTFDVDGFSDRAISNLFMGEYSKAPCTPKGIIKWLEYEGVNFEGKKVVIINRSNIVGKPLALMLINKGSTVTVCHSRTIKDDLKEYIKQADIIMVAVGQAGFLDKEFEIKDNAIIVDIGINRANNKICGDVKVDDFKDKDVIITAVPGGVGKITTLMVVDNLMPV